MTYDLDVALRQMRQLDTTGNIIPHSWYKVITFGSGKPDLLGIMIMAEIVYWYRPTEIRDQYTGKLLEYRKKFKGHMLQRTYASLGEQFGVSTRQAMDAVKRLEESGFVIKEVRHVQTATVALGNVLFLAPNIEKLLSLQTETTTFNPTDPESGEGATSIATPHTFERISSYDESHKLMQSNVEAPTVQRRTYTENTTEISSEIKKTAAESHIPFEQKLNIAAAKFEKKLAHLKIPQTAPVQPTVAYSVEHASNRFPQMQIGKSLTDAQAMQVTKMAAEMVKNKRHSNAKQLAEEMTFVLLSAETFTQAGNDFCKKLNTVLKCIREGRWSRPKGLQEKDDKAINKTQQIQKAKQYELEGECAHWEKMAQIFKGKNNPMQMQVAMVEHQKAQANLDNYMKAQH